MKSFICGIIVLCLCQLLAAQEPVLEFVPPLDSVRPERPLFYEPGLEMPLIQDEMNFLPDFKFKPEIPVFDFSRYLNSRWSIDYSYFTGDFSGLGFNRSPYLHPFFSPFGMQGTIFNQAVYRISDKFQFGGNSFGGNSPFRAPLPRSGAGSYDFRGASLFLEYKVSKNFRIGGGITVTDHPHQP